MSFFTALFEPLINRHRVSWREMLFSLLGVLGIFLIFNFDTRYRAGIGMGVVSSALASLFTICNKKVSAGYPASTMLLYEMGGGFLGLKIEKKEEILDKEIEDLIQERQAARKAKDFKRADEIRDELLKKGIILKDTREGVKWQRA